MKFKARYSIGDMSRICNISKKALRYYDKIGLITSQRHDFNNYRYYTSDSLLIVPVIKYYKQMGFTLDEMQAFIEGGVPNGYQHIQNSFLTKSGELEREQAALQRKNISVKDWYNMVIEAQMVSESHTNEVSVRYVEPVEHIYQDQIFENDLKAAIINIDWVNYLDQIENEITGPVIIRFSSLKDRLEDKEQPIRIEQKPLLPAKASDKCIMGGCMMATCYHIGPHETLGDAYKRLLKWSSENNYVLSEHIYERYVADYWLSSDTSLFVTELMVEVSRKGVVVAGSAPEPEE